MMLDNQTLFILGGAVSLLLGFLATYPPMRRQKRAAEQEEAREKAQKAELALMKATLGTEYVPQVRWTQIVHPDVGVVISGLSNVGELPTVWYEGWGPAQQQPGTDPREQETKPTPELQATRPVQN